MKKVLILMMFFLSACGSEEAVEQPTPAPDYKQACEWDSIYAGEWINSDLEELILRDDCFGYEQRCDMNFSYYKPVDGKVMIDVESKNQAEPNCPELGETLCEMVHDTFDDGAEYLTVDCGAGDTFYFPKS